MYGSWSADKKNFSNFIMILTVYNYTYDFFMNFNRRVGNIIILSQQ